MTMLSINHGAKGIVMWTFPTTDELTELTSRFGRVLTGKVAPFVFGVKMLRNLEVEGGQGVDVSAWIVGDRILLSIVNPAHQDALGALSVHLPSDMRGTDVATTLWGDGGWRLTGGGATTQLTRSGMEALRVDILILTI